MGDMLSDLALILSLLAAPQSVGPSFDCVRAATETEHAICADAGLARLDRRMAAAYAAARQSLPAPARRLLADDQRWFLGTRDAYYEGRAQYEWAATLTDRLNGRASFLESIDPAPRNGLVGHWGNTAIGIEVSQLANGRLHISAGGADPLTGRWTCGIEVDAVVRGRTAYATDNDTPEWGMQLIRDGATLRVTEIGPDGQEHSSGYCGNGGSVAGQYLPVMAGSGS